MGLENIQIWMTWSLVSCYSCSIVWATYTNNLFTPISPSDCVYYCVYSTIVLTYLTQNLSSVMLLHQTYLSFVDHTFSNSFERVSTESMGSQIFHNGSISVKELRRNCPQDFKVIVWRKHIRIKEPKITQYYTMLVFYMQFGTKKYLSLFF